jgi:L-alanine-DL-glutamate epimerase-like enolase superfamily enzyme
MIPTSIQALPLAIPFKTAFKHASAERAATQSILVAVRSSDQTLGIGEGCPRDYVTGETIDSALAFVAAHQQDFLARAWDIAALIDWADRHRPEIDANPSAWSAVELALLDLLGKIHHKPVEALLGLPALAGKYRYTAVLGDASKDKFEAQLAHYLQARFDRFKIKLSGDFKRDQEKIAALERMNIAPPTVRADANNLWRDADTAIAYLRLLNYPFFALEEPLPVGDYDGMLRIAAKTGVRIILDESLLRKEQLANLDSDSDCWIVNLRISKMGGLLRSLKLVHEIRERGMHVNIGAHVGETSILTRSGLTVASTARDILAGHEGAFGTHLLEYDITDMPLMFGAGGVLDANDLSTATAGLGIDIREEFLAEGAAGRNGTK